MIVLGRFAVGHRGGSGVAGDGDIRRDVSPAVDLLGGGGGVGAIVGLGGRGER